MKRYCIVIAVIFCQMASAQEPTKDSVNYERFIAEAGIRIPLAKMADKIGPSPEFGFWFRSRIPNNDWVDVGFSLCTPTNRREFIYMGDKATYTVKPAAVSGMVGVRFNKIYALGGNRFKKTLEWSTTAGYAFFMYSDKEFNIGRNGQDAYTNTVAKALSTFQLGQGVMFSLNNLGLQLHYNYTPYGLFSNHVSNDFGSHSLTVGVFYKQ